MKKISKVLTGLVASLTLFGGLFNLNHAKNGNGDIINLVSGDKSSQKKKPNNCYAVRRCAGSVGV